MISNTFGFWAPQPWNGALKGTGMGWHYTDAAGLIGMLGSARIWATRSVALNDSSELLYGLDVVNKVAKRLRIDGLQIGVDVGRRALEGVHILSASRDGNTLGQWLNYSKIDGYAVALDLGEPLVFDSDPNNLRSSAAYELKTQWIDVIYDPAEQEAMAESVLRSLVWEPGPGRGWSVEAYVAWDSVERSVLMSLICSMKDPAFRDEREVRCITEQFYGIPLHRSSGSRIIPYVALKGLERAPEPQSDKYHLPIRAIRCGPGCRPGTDSIISELLEAHGYKVPVDQSAIPYRN